MGAVLKFTFFVSLLFFIDICRSASLRTDSNADGDLVYLKTVDLPAIPDQIRYKSVYYKGKDVIKGIEVTDLTDTNAVAVVKSGGVGYSFIKIKMQSEQGEPLNYQVKIFV